MTSAGVSPQAESFVRDGYLVIEDLVPAADRDRIVADADKFVTGEDPVANLPDDGNILAVHFPHWVSPVATEMLAHPGLVDVLSQICAAHVPEWDGSVKAMQSMLFFKPPGLQGQAWHQDERYIPTRDRSLVGAWIALDDATIENGCLWVLPGSHRMGRIYPTRDHGQPDEFDPTDEAYGFDDADAIPVEVKAGSVVFFNGYLLHRSQRNRSTGTRMALVNHYMNAWSPLPWLLENGIDVGTADNRRITLVSGVDPYEANPIVDPPDVTFVRAATGRSNINDPLHVDTSIEIAAPRELVWSVLTDLPSYGEWNPYIQQVDGTGEPGTTVTVTALPTGAEESMTYPVEVIAVEAPTLLKWEGGFPDRLQWCADHRWELAETDTGTVVRHHERFSGELAESILAENRDRVITDFGRFNEALKAESERRFAK